MDSQLIIPPFPLILSTLYFLAFFYFKALHIAPGHLQATSGPIGRATFDVNILMAHDVVINGRGKGGGNIVLWDDPENLRGRGEREVIS